MVSQKKLLLLKMKGCPPIRRLVVELPSGAAVCLLEYSPVIEVSLVARIRSVFFSKLIFPLRAEKKKCTWWVLWKALFNLRSKTIILNKSKLRIKPTLHKGGHSLLRSQSWRTQDGGQHIAITQLHLHARRVRASNSLSQRNERGIEE
jgi:hypothetical protein